LSAAGEAAKSAPTTAKPKTARRHLDYLTIKEAADKLALTMNEVRQMAKDGKVRAFHDRGRLHFRTREIEAYATARSHQPVGLSATLDGANLYEDVQAEALRALRKRFPQ